MNECETHWHRQILSLPLFFFLHPLPSLFFYLSAGGDSAFFPADGVTKHTSTYIKTGGQFRTGFRIFIDLTVDVVDRALGHVRSARLQCDSSARILYVLSHSLSPHLLCTCRLRSGISVWQRVTSCANYCFTLCYAPIIGNNNTNPFKSLHAAPATGILLANVVSIPHPLPDSCLTLAPLSLLCAL